MAKQLINRGITAGDGTGDPLREAFGKCNDNFNELYIDKLVYVKSLVDLPSPSGGVITLTPYNTYVIIGNIDLAGNRLVCANVSINGTSASVNTLTSTGLAGGQYLITATGSFSIKDVFINGSNTYNGISFNEANGNALIELCVFNNLPKGLLTANASNILINRSNFVNSDIEYTGNIGFSSIRETILFQSVSGKTAINITSTVVVANRVIITDSAFTVPSGSTGLNANVSASFLDECLQLKACRFTGAGTRVAGILQDNNKAFFSENIGILNTAINGQLYMNNNTTATVISTSNTFVKIAGTTTPSTDNAKYLHSNNRLTCDAAIERKYLIQCNLSFSAGNANVCTFGFYDSKLGLVRLPSRTKGTANSSGNAENISFMCVTSHAQGDYIEIHVANATATNVTVSDMNVVITQIV